MKISQFDYSLPQKLIAQFPVEPRDHAKLLTLDRNTGSISHKIFSEVEALLGSKDVLVLNKTKVFPARLRGIKKDTKGKVESGDKFR